jgi:hypothetical protein
MHRATMKNTLCHVALTQRGFCMLASGIDERPASIQELEQSGVQPGDLRFFYIWSYLRTITRWSQYPQDPYLRLC